jgi:hypothetical protein
MKCEGEIAMGIGKEGEGGVNQPIKLIKSIINQTKPSVNQINQPINQFINQITPTNG